MAVDPNCSVNVFKYDSILALLSAKLYLDWTLITLYYQVKDFVWELYVSSLELRRSCMCHCMSSIYWRFFNHMVRTCTSWQDSSNSAHIILPTYFLHWPLVHTQNILWLTGLHVGYWSQLQLCLQCSDIMWGSDLLGREKVGTISHLPWCPWAPLSTAGYQQGSMGTLPLTARAHTFTKESVFWKLTGNPRSSCSWWHHPS